MKRKSIIVSVLVELLWAIVAVLTYRSGTSAFNLIEAFFAVFGYIMFGLCLARWLSAPESCTALRGRRQK